MKETLLKGQAFPLDDQYQLSLLLPGDIDDIITMLGDERVTEFLWFAPAPESFYRDYFNPMAEQNVAALEGEGEPAMTMVIRCRTSGEFAGMAAIVPMGMIPGVYEIGYQLPFHTWGKGLATRISQLLIRFGFETLEAHKITADCYASNIGSQKVMQKVGMVKEGHQKDFYPYKGGFDDRLHYGISSTPSC
ncbi:MAG: GNAT family N-acetyltransferase [Endozoicomonas sp.]